MPGRLATRQARTAAVIAPAKLRLSSLAALVMLSACATVPTGPTVPVLPGTGTSFDQFRADDAVCQQYALAQVGGTSPDKAATGSGARSAAQTSADDTQRRYDLSYIQCMYVKGHRVPVLGPMTVRPAQAVNPPPSAPR
jgi:hypothetical protein